MLSARPDFSMVELLDILSPVPAPRRSRWTTDRAETSLRVGGAASSRSLLTAAAPHLQRSSQRSSQPSALQDPEESRILEDIFFVC